MWTWMGDDVSGSSDHPPTWMALPLAVAKSSEPIGLVSTTTHRHASSVLAPEPVLMPYAHTLCPPGPTPRNASKPCESPKLGKTRPTSGRLCDALPMFVPPLST